MSKVIHRHEVIKAADELFDGRLRRLEAQLKVLESEIAYLKKFHSENIDATDVPVFEELKLLKENKDASENGTQIEKASS